MHALVTAGLLQEVFGFEVIVDQIRIPKIPLNKDLQIVSISFKFNNTLQVKFSHFIDLFFIALSPLFSLPLTTLAILNSIHSIFQPHFIDPKNALWLAL